MRANKVFLIYVEFGSRNRKVALPEVRGLIERLLPGSLVTIVIVDNSSIATNVEVQTSDNALAIAGDNSSRDLSGYDCGTQFVLDNITPPKNSIFVYANDMLSQSSSLPSLKKFSSKSAQYGLSKKMVLGYVDRFPEVSYVFGMPLYSWVKTNFLIVPYCHLRKVLPFAISNSDEELFSQTSKSFFGPRAPMSANYQNYIQTWLFGKKDPGGEFSEVWLSAQALTSGNFKEMKTKARAIFSEHFLGARLHKQKISILPLNQNVIADLSNRTV